MKKLLKWLGILLGILLLVGAISAFVMVSKFNSRMNHLYEVPVESLNIPSDSASIAQGSQFIPFCQSCHGEALQGKVFFTDPKIGTIFSPNLTSGEGGVGKYYKDQDWIRSLRHGINPAGKALFVMPSANLNHLDEHDLACLIAHLKTLPPVDGEKGTNRIPTFTKLLMQMGAFGEVFAAEIIDHNAAFKKAPSREESAAYGEYIVNVTECKTCHQPDLKGGKSPDPNSPPVPNITNSGVCGKWGKEGFIQTMRTGITPENKILNDSFMPWKHIGQLSDADLGAIQAYLRTK